MAKDGDGGSLRYSVIPGPTGPRRWPDEVKARIVAESFVPGARIGQVARRHGVLPSQLTTWRRMAKGGLLVLPWEGFGPPGQDPGQDFVPLVVEEDPAAATELAPRPDASGASGQVEIAVGAVVVRLAGDVPVARLSALVRALAEGSPQ